MDLVSKHLNAAILLSVSYTLLILWYSYFNYYMYAYKIVVLYLHCFFGCHCLYIFMSHD